MASKTSAKTSNARKVIAVEATDTKHSVVEAVDTLFDSGIEFCEAEQLAALLGRSGKVLRAHLRSRHARAFDQKNSRWKIAHDTAIECAEWSIKAKTIANK